MPTISTKTWLTIVVFAAYLGLGLSLVRDYGISWDEPAERDYGHALVDYVFKSNPRLLHERIRYQGPPIEFGLYSAERLLGLTDTRDVYFMRHRATFFVFFGGVVAFFLLVTRLCGSSIAGLLGAALLVLHPRLFADSFYNSKDIPFLSLFVVSCLTLVMFTERRTPRRLIVHALTCGLLIAMRLAGLIVPMMTVLWMMVDQRQQSRRRAWPMCAVYLALIALTVWFLWPTLWRDPIREFVAALQENSKFPFTDSVRYMGKDLAANALPWHYVPVWIAISSPPSSLAWALLGGVVAIGRLMTRGTMASRGADLLSVMWVGAPLLLLVLVHPVLYDGWRHMFFVYPGIVVMAVLGIRFLWTAARTVKNATGRSVARGLVAGLVAFTLLVQGRVIYAYHPFQQVYFNALVGGVAGAQGDFDVDYWGLSYRQALEHVLSVDRAADVSVYVAQEVGEFNADILPVRDRQRLRFVSDVKDAKYRLTNFRWDQDATMGDPFYAVVVEGAEILSVRRIADGPHD